ncbi:alpha/beta fold hydrolase [Saccharopolyspora karakumensis]|uniref:Alpha/beta fold hydrolase n=1 Tax=Saccharopolyspora karakumensis TaxID=2530386 RepID=A0A4R5C3J6_9PSEU|nr:alpha/beta fold hydrolase [Saccharopolyspora karakumensis]TDD93149.1 alpha/beta fold hydrolase [Saccharopolyspora karakumensis]
MTAPPQGVEVDQIEFPAGKVRYYKAGTEGPPIVLLHGGGPDNALLSWRNTIGVLAADHRVYAPDLPGQGGSTEWRGRGNQRTFEEVLRWLLDAWRIPQATLVGLSMGGSIATGFTLRHPQRVRALALVDSTGMQQRMPHHLATYLLMRTGFSGRMAATLLRSNRSLARFALNKVFFADASSVRDLESIVDEVSAEAAVRRSVFADWHADAINRRSMTINHLPQLNRITCPVTVIHGEEDALVPVASAQEVAGAIPGAQLRVMPQAGHWPNRERPTEFNALLREFVNAVNTQAIVPQKGTSDPAQRDESAEAPTHRLKVPKPGESADSPGTEDSPAAKDESVDSPTKLLKVGAVSAAPEPDESTEDTAGTAESADSEKTESAEAKPAEETKSAEPEPAEKTESAEGESAAEKTDDADSAEKKPADDSVETTGAEADAEKKATTDAPTRFLKVGSEPATPAADEEPETETDESTEKSSDTTTEDDEKPKKDDSQDSGDKPTT